MSTFAIFALLQVAFVSQGSASISNALDSLLGDGCIVVFHGLDSDLVQVNSKFVLHTHYYSFPKQLKVITSI